MQWQSDFIKRELKNWDSCDQYDCVNGESKEKVIKMQLKWCYCPTCRLQSNEDAYKEIRDCNKADDNAFEFANNGKDRTLHCHFQTKPDELIICTRTPACPLSLGQLSSTKDFSSWISVLGMPLSEANSSELTGIHQQQRGYSGHSVNKFSASFPGRKRNIQQQLSVIRSTSKAHFSDIPGVNAQGKKPQKSKVAQTFNFLQAVTSAHRDSDTVLWQVFFCRQAVWKKC